MIVFLDFDGVTLAFFPQKDLTDEEKSVVLLSSED